MVNIMMMAKALRVEKLRRYTSTAQLGEYLNRPKLGVKPSPRVKPLLMMARPHHP
jgi:hypothetical protein